MTCLEAKIVTESLKAHYRGEPPAHTVLCNRTIATPLSGKVMGNYSAGNRSKNSWNKILQGEVRN